MNKLINLISSWPWCTWTQIVILIQKPFILSLELHSKKRVVTGYFFRDFRKWTSIPFINHTVAVMCSSIWVNWLKIIQPLPIDTPWGDEGAVMSVWKAIAERLEVFPDFRIMVPFVELDIMIGSVIGTCWRKKLIYGVIYTAASSPMKIITVTASFSSFMMNIHIQGQNQFCKEGMWTKNVPGTTEFNKWLFNAYHILRYIFGLTQSITLTNFQANW